MTTYQGIPAITKAKDMYTSCVNVGKLKIYMSSQVTARDLHCNKKDECFPTFDFFNKKI
jgi:hypothetical protein